MVHHTEVTLGPRSPVRSTPTGGLDGERKADEEADSHPLLEADEAA
jgi:hypothetical protein